MSINEWKGFSESSRKRQNSIVKTKNQIIFKQPISLVKYFNSNDPPNKISSSTDFELNFSSFCHFSDQGQSNSLPYVKIFLGNHDNNFKTIGLLDTGCSWSICEFKTFIKIPNFKDFIIEELKDSKISCANDSSMKIEYKAKIPITFTAEDNKKVKYEKIFYVVRNLIHPVFLGYEMIDGMMGKAIFPQSLVLVDPKDKQDVQIPIIRQLKEPQINFTCVSDTYLLPHQTSFIKIKPEEDILVNKPFIIDTLDSDDNDTWQILPSIQELSASGEYYVGIKNLSDQPIGFSEAHTIARTNLDHENSTEMKAYSISISSGPSGSDFYVDPSPTLINHEKFSEIHVCNVQPKSDKQTDPETIKRENIETWKEINDLPQITKGEKDFLFNQYLEKGFYQIPCTYLYEDPRNYCEFPIEGDCKVLTKEEVLDSFNLKHLSVPQQKAIRKLLEEFIDIWSTHEWDIGVTDLVECDVVLKEDAKSKVHNSKIIPLTPKTKAKIVVMLEEMRKAGVVGKCPDATNFVSNILIIPKHNDPTKFRFLIDLRMINNCSMSIPTKFTPLEEVLQFMCNKKWLTCADIANGFYQLRVKPDKIPLFSFIHPSGEKWALLRSPQGYCNSPFYFTQLMAILMKNFVHGTFFADDIYVGTEDKSVEVNGKTLNDFEFHVHALRELFTRIREANIKMKPTKINICTSNISVLGFRYNNRKFSIPEAKVRAFIDWEPPKTRKKLVGFLQSANYYSRCLPQLSAVKFPLQEMTRSSHQGFKWDSKAQEAFEAVKELIKNHKNLTPFNPAYPVEFHSDACKYACGSVVIQKLPREDDPTILDEHIIQCASRTFTKAESNLHIYKQEVVGLNTTFTSNKWIGVQSDDITVKIDAKGIMYMRACKDDDPILTRCSTLVSTFAVSKIDHVKGSEHILADEISRSRAIEADLPVGTMSNKEAELLLSLFELPDNYSISRSRLRELLNSNGLLSILEDKLHKKKTTKATLSKKSLTPTEKYQRKIKLPKTVPSLRQYSSQIDDILEEQPNFLKDENGKMPEVWSQLNVLELRQGEAQQETEQNILTSIKLNSDIIKDGCISLQLFKEAQETDFVCREIFDLMPLNGFVKRKGILIKILKNGEERLMLPESLVKPIFYQFHFKRKHASLTEMIGMIEDIYYIQGLKEKLKPFIDSCLYCITEKSQSGKYASFGKKSFPARTREVWYIDLAVSMPPSRNYENFIVFVDGLSLFALICPLKTRKANEIVYTFKEKIVSTFGKPKKIFSDQEGAVISELMNQYCVENGIEIETTARASSWENQPAEKTIGIAKQALRLIGSQTGSVWTDSIVDVTNDLNRRRLNTTFTPNSLMFGYDNDWDQPLEVIEDTAGSVEEYAGKILKMVLKKQEEHKKVREKLADNKRRSINKSRKETTIQENDIVVYRNHNQNDICNGLKSPYFGPFIVEKVFPNNAHCQIRNTITDKVLMAHKIHLRPYNPGSINIPLPPRNEAVGLLSQKKDSEPPPNVPASFTRSKDPTEDCKDNHSKVCKDKDASKVCKDSDTPSAVCKDSNSSNAGYKEIYGSGKDSNVVTKVKKKRRTKIVYDPHPTKTRERIRKKIEANAITPMLEKDANCSTNPKTTNYEYYIEIPTYEIIENERATTDYFIEGYIE